MTLDDLADAARTDPAQMPELVAMSRRLLADPDPQTRTDAAAMVFYAVRQVLPTLTIAERTTLCEATLVELARRSRAASSGRSACSLPRFARYSWT